VRERERERETPGFYTYSLRVGGILHPICKHNFLFSRKDIYQYKLPSKYSKKFLLNALCYIDKNAVLREVKFGEGPNNYL
jgi:hypothetical protein